jgi:hypothetical protein
MIKSILIVVVTLFPLIFFGQNYKNRTVIGEDNARQAVKNALSDSTYKLTYDTLIRDKDVAITIAEPILFSIYGKAAITGEKPYECYLIDGYWFLSGTLPKNYSGGVFEIIMSAKDARIIKITHGK